MKTATVICQSETYMNKESAKNSIAVVETQAPGERRSLYRAARNSRYQRALSLSVRC
jgi:hypothetical protein